MSTQKSILITGCSDGGIGSGLALAFQKRGLHVFATARDTSKMGKLKELGGVTLLELDTTKPSHISSAVEAVKQETGGVLDYLVNNAARNHFMPILDLNLEEAKELFDNNLWATIAVTQAFAPLVIAAKGNIANITSISGHLNVPFMGTYAASKAAIELLSDTLRLELAPLSVGVLSVVTGAVQTNGQTYFGDWKLPENSRYKSIEETIKTRAQGGDGVPRMTLEDYSDKVADEIVGGAVGKFWYGNNAESTKFATTSQVPASAMDAGMVHGTGLETLTGQH